MPSGSAVVAVSNKHQKETGATRMRAIDEFLDRFGASVIALAKHLRTMVGRYGQRIPGILLYAAVVFGCVTIAHVWGPYVLYSADHLVEVGVAAITAAAEPAAIDITFSLECDQLESQTHERIHLTWNLDAFKRIEQMEPLSSSKSYRDWWASTGVKDYDKGVRLAFNHGLPDGNSTWASGGLRVVAATQERIDLKGHGRDGVIGAENGFIDRRTGYGEIWHFLSDS